MAPDSAEIAGILARLGIFLDRLPAEHAATVTRVTAELDGAVVDVLRSSSSLRALAEVLINYAGMAEHLAATQDAEHENAMRRTIAEHRAAMTRGGS